MSEFWRKKNNNISLGSFYNKDESLWLLRLLKKYFLYKKVDAEKPNNRVSN